MIAARGGFTPQKNQRRTNMKVSKDAEPPSRVSCPLFMIGQDSRGRWVVCEQSGARGGLFINRAEALRYIRFENENHPHATVMVAGILELDLAGNKKAHIRTQSGASNQRELQVA
jgi:hypothetical protein